MGASNTVLFAPTYHSTFNNMSIKESTMKLVNIRQYKRNSKVTANGNVYLIGKDGILTDAEGNDEIPDDDANRLLLDPDEWRDASIKLDREALKSKMALLDANGNEIDVEAELEKAQAEESPDEESPDEESPDEEAQVFEIPDDPDDLEAWPDLPEEYSEALSREFLEKLAATVEVKFSPRLGDEKLFSRIVDAMYDEE